jgi:hypothetical protein
MATGATSPTSIIALTPAAKLAAIMRTVALVVDDDIVENSRTGGGQLTKGCRDGKRYFAAPKRVRP